MASARNSFDEARLGTAVNALDAVRDLCCEAACTQSSSDFSPGMHMVSPDNFAALLGLIVGEMRAAQGTDIR